MAWVAVDINGDEFVYRERPNRSYKNEYWTLGIFYIEGYVKLPKGSIKKLIGRELTWDDEPAELKEEKE